AFVQRLIVSLRGEGLRGDVHRAFRFTVVLEEARDWHEAKIILALTERGSFLREHTDDCVRVAADSYHFADRRFVREQTFLDHFAHDNYPARKFDVFFVQVPSVTERVSVCGEETPVCPNYEKAGRGLHAVVNSLSFHLVTKNFETDFASVAFHQLRVMQRLAIRDVAAVLIFFLDLAADIHVRRV